MTPTRPSLAVSSSFFTGLAASALALAALGAPCNAQAGGFVAGDVYESNDAVHVFSTPGASLQRLDPASGNVTALFGSYNQSGFGSLAYDTYRHRLIWRGTLDQVTHAQRIWQVDAAGNPTDMQFTSATYVWFAPTGDGRIYCKDGNFPNRIAWIDAANRPHFLLDQAGSVPFTVGQGPLATTRGIVYDPGTNALYSCSLLDCSGVSNAMVNVGRLPLSADGTRVAGPLDCVSFDVTPSLDVPTSLSRMANGHLLVTVSAPDGNPVVPLSRLLEFDPATFAIAPFASPGYTNMSIDFTLDDGVWSSRLGKALVLDTFGNKLHAWGAGQSGAGSVITPVGGTFAIPSAEAEQIVEIPAGGCDGAWAPYGKGLAGAGGFVPGFWGEGCPEPGGAITLRVDAVRGGASGVMFFGFSATSVPFRGGQFLVGTLALSANVFVTGAAGVPGDGGLTIPTVLLNDPGISGISLYLQAGFVDAAAVKGVSLTQGVQMEIG
ncbi:MAG: hypothetical protein H6697_11745 [Myxococcales bacterium]|nr:hypothetical protein [Myxococcales bacterium]